MNTSKRSTAWCALLLGALPLLANGCDTEEALLPSDYVEAEADNDVNDDVDEDLDDGFRTWTGYVSEENPPLICSNRYAARGFDCSGSYCDNVSMDCRYLSATIGESSWIPYFSEEGSATADEGHCWGSNQWMTGVVCSGSYCDNLSLRCTAFPGTSAGDCHWSSWYSEEQSPFYAPFGYYIKGLECDGNYCDNKRYRYCKQT
ncbi:hypothetical protein ENSA5_23580 [Enhygromyxa salina]|uniref:Lipoprotein n=1 Tax=Enhygromyxa salina TaxID=215803 RepID=A0A2S9YBP3_9BACT|nr:hypothetical protein [Enhygromyxa salina]PRQ02431.1 hypothetical protein ENSA5_23580 [Enhygromyxa salina]